MKLPFPRSYWAEPGRLLAGFYPGDKDPHVADVKLRALLDSGVTRIINLMEPNETDPSGQPFVRYDTRFQELAAARGRDVQSVRFPIVDCAVPTPGLMHKILEDITTALAQNETIYVHCWGGRGRTATVIGCHLRRTHGWSGAETIARLQELTQHNTPIFWPIPQMPCQRVYN